MLIEKKIQTNPNPVIKAGTILSAVAFENRNAKASVRLGVTLDGGETETIVYMSLEGGAAKVTKEVLSSYGIETASDALDIPAKFMFDENWGWRLLQKRQVVKGTSLF